MGMCFSSKPSSTSFNSIRVIQLDGYVEDFYEPVTVREITENYPKHYLCTMAQLVPNSKLFQLETQLQPGTLYLLLPYSLFQSDTSPVNMVSLGRRLAAIANTKSSNQATRRPSNVAKGGLIVERNHHKAMISKGDLVVVSDDQKCALNTYKEQQFWKPILDSIVEKSMEYRCESDFDDMINSSESFS